MIAGSAVCVIHTDLAGEDGSAAQQESMAS
jgi:hypothetical protein